MPCSSAVFARVSTVQMYFSSSGQVALYTMAAGVSFGYPPAISRRDSSAIIPVLR